MQSRRAAEIGIGNDAHGARGQHEAGDVIEQDDRDQQQDPLEIGGLRHDGTHEPGRDVDEQQGGYRQRHDGKLEKQAEMAPINREGSVEDLAEVQGPNVRHRDSLRVRGGGKMLR